MNDPIKVHEHGFVRLVDVMGDDSAIVQAARVSYGAGTKAINEDRGLIRYLMRHRHTTPFEMVEFKFHLKMPIFVARQWVRHRMASINEYSARYSEMKDEFYFPNTDDVRKQSKVNKQGSGVASETEVARDWMQWLRIGCSAQFYDYMGAIKHGIARELARIGLPLNVYTEMYWKIDLHNLLHFLNLRMDKHAQKEIRDFANVIAGIVKQQCPLAYEAFEDYVLYAHTFSRQEMTYIRVLAKEHFEWLDMVGRADLSMSKRETEEFLEALK
jgi:thymidylate synthase (FAD)